MGHFRTPVSIRVVPLAAERSDTIGAALTPAERLALVDELTQEGWVLSGRALPTYTRSEMPIQIRRLREVKDRRI